MPIFTPLAYSLFSPSTFTKTVISSSRHEAASHPDLGVQLDVFEEQRESDEAQGPGGINLNSHLDVFYAILKQVSFLVIR